MEPITNYENNYENDLENNLETSESEYFDSVASLNKPTVNISQVERIVSVAGGALLLMAGLTKIMGNSTGAFLKAVAGGYLLYRGTSGHCAINEAIGRNTADEDLEF